MFFLPTVSLFFFALSSVLALAGFKHGDRAKFCKRLALYGFAGGALCITIRVLIYDSTSVLLLTAAVSWMGVISVFLFNIREIISFLAPLATLILLLQSLFTPPPLTLPKVVNGAVADLHIWLAVCGEAFAIGACGLSLLYLWQRRVLKKKLLKWAGTEMPALDRIGRSLTLSLWVGFIFLTVCLLTGAIAFPLINAGLQLQLKVIWAVAVWVWYLAILICHNVFRSSHKNTARMSLGGFLLLAVSFFGLLFFKQQGGV